MNELRPLCVFSVTVQLIILSLGFTPNYFSRAANVPEFVYLGNCYYLKQYVKGINSAEVF